MRVHLSKSMKLKPLSVSLSDEERELDALTLSQDTELIAQIKKSQQDRELNDVFAQEAGLKYLRGKIEDFERGQKL